MRNKGRLIKNVGEAVEQRYVNIHIFVKTHIKLIYNQYILR